MELKQVQSDLCSLTKLYSLLQINQDDSSQMISFILDERSKFLLKNLLDDAMDKLLVTHSKIIDAAKSGVFNTPRSSASMTLKTVTDLEPSDSAKLLTASSQVPFRIVSNGDSSSGSKRLLKEEQQSIIKPTSIQETVSDVSKLGSISSYQMDNRKKRCRICQRSKSMNQVSNYVFDQSNDINGKEKGLFEVDKMALVPAMVVEKPLEEDGRLIERKPSNVRLVVSASASPGTRTTENNEKAENVRSVVFVSTSPGTRTAENNTKAEKTASDFPKKLVNAVKETESGSLSNSTAGCKGNSSKSKKEIRERVNKNSKVKDIVQKIESVSGAANKNNNFAKGSGSRIPLMHGNGDLSAKKRTTKSRSSIPTHKRCANHQVLMKPTLLDYDDDDGDGDNDNDNASDDNNSGTDDKSQKKSSSFWEESEEELTNSTSQSDPGSSFDSSTSQQQISSSSHSLPRSNSSSVAETSTEECYANNSNRSMTASSSVTPGTYSDQDVDSSEKDSSAGGIGKLQKLKNKLALIFHHHHHHHHHHDNKENYTRTGHNTSKWNNRHKKVKQKTKKHKYEKQAVEKLRKAVVVHKSKKKGNQAAQFRGLVQGLVRHVKHSKKAKATVGGGGGGNKQPQWWKMLQHHHGLVKRQRKGRVRVGFRKNKPTLRASKMS